MLSLKYGDAVHLSPDVSSNVTRYHWAPASGLDYPDIRDPVASPKVTTTYTLTVTSAGGCETAATVTVKVSQPMINIPNTFTPNGDGLNDTWNIPFLTEYPVASLNIYNRYGMPVFNSKSYQTPWDGTYHHQALPEGIYYYIIQPVNSSMPPLAGYITLIR